MFDASGQYIGPCKQRRRSVTFSPCPPPPLPAPSPAIAADLDSSLLSFLSLSSSACPPTFSQWLTLPDALLARHLRNSDEVALLQRIASSAAQLDQLMERLYAAILEGESLEHVQRHLPHRCPSLPDPPPTTVSSDSSESSSSSSSSDSSAPAAEQAALHALSVSLAPFVHCTFPAAHQPSFAVALSSAVGKHVQSIGAVFVELTGVLLDVQKGLGTLQETQRMNETMKKEFQLYGCDELAASKAAVAELEGNLIDRIMTLLSARLTYQRQQPEAAPSQLPAVAAAAVGDATVPVQSQAAASSSAAAAPTTGPGSTSVLDEQTRPAQSLPPNSPSPSVGSSSSSSSSSTSSSSLSPNTRLDVILGLQPAASAKRKAHNAFDAQYSLPLPGHEQMVDEKDDEQPLCRSQPTVKRARVEQSNQTDTVQQQSGVHAAHSDQANVAMPASTRVLFASDTLGGTDGAAVAQSSIPDSPHVTASVPSPEAMVALTIAAALPPRPASPVCDMQLSLSSSASSSAAPASPSSCPPSPAISPLMSASRPTPATAHRSSSPSQLTAPARSHSTHHLTALGYEKQSSPMTVSNRDAVAAVALVEAHHATAAALLGPLSPSVDMSVDDTEEEDNERHTTLLDEPLSTAADSGRVAATEAAAAAVAAVVGSDVFVASARALSQSRCSQERGAVEGMAGVDAEGGANVAMPPVDADPLQLHSSQPQTMV